MPNTIAAVSCQPSPRSAASAISTAPPASAAAAPTPWVSALANSSRGSWTRTGAACIRPPCAVVVEQLLGCIVRLAIAALPARQEQRGGCAFALQRNRLADENVTTALRRRLRLGQGHAAAVGQFDPRLFGLPVDRHRAAVAAGVADRVVARRRFAHRGGGVAAGGRVGRGGGVLPGLHRRAPRGILRRGPAGAAGQGGDEDGRKKCAAHGGLPARGAP